MFQSFLRGMSISTVIFKIDRAKQPKFVADNLTFRKIKQPPIEKVQQKFRSFSSENYIYIKCSCLFSVVLTEKDNKI